MYENSNSFLKDYRINQPIRQSIRWTSFGAAVGVGSGIISKDYWAIIGYGILGTGLGFLGGTTYGTVRGFILEKHRKDNPNFQTKRFHIGNEYSNVMPLSHDGRFNPKYSLIFQTFSTNRFSPSEYRLGITRKDWSTKGVNYDLEGYKHRYYADEVKLDFNVLFNSNIRFINFFYGTGIGYSWGENRDDYYPSDDKRYYYEFSEVKKIEGIFMRSIVGVSINFADFFFGRLEFDYELSGFFYKALDYNDFSYLGNSHMSFTIGTYLF